MLIYHNNGFQTAATLWYGVLSLYGHMGVEPARWDRMWMGVEMSGEETQDRIVNGWLVVS